MTDLTALEAEIKDACRAWVKSGNKLVRRAWGRRESDGTWCGCALTALAWHRAVSLMSIRLSGECQWVAVGWDNWNEGKDRDGYQLGARIAAWAEQEGILS
jgi:capsid protein